MFHINECYSSLLQEEEQVSVVHQSTAFDPARLSDVIIIAYLCSFWAFDSLRVHVLDLISRIYYLNLT